MSDVEAALGRANSSYCRHGYFLHHVKLKLETLFQSSKVHNLHTMKAAVESLLVLPLSAVRVACGQLSLSTFLLAASTRL